MADNKRQSFRLDVLGLLLAGLINTFLASFDAVFVVGPGTVARQPDMMQRVNWIAENTVRWQFGWLFWFAVTLSFSWSFYALGRHLISDRPWFNLAIGLALIAAAVDIVGVQINLSVLPELAYALSSTDVGSDPTIGITFYIMESLANALTNVTAFGIYTAAGLLLLPVLFSTETYPRALASLGAAEWGIAAVATLLLIFAPDLAMVPLIASFALYAPWVWGSALWLMQSESRG